VSIARDRVSGGMTARERKASRLPNLVPEESKTAQEQPAAPADPGAFPASPAGTAETATRSGTRAAAPEAGTGPVETMTAETKAGQTSGIQASGAQFSSAGTSGAQASGSGAGIAGAGYADAGLAGSGAARIGAAWAGMSADSQPAADRNAIARAGRELSARLGALARMVQIGSARSGPDGISRELLDDATALLTRAGQRLQLSSAHTVVALAGGTGSGKSSLFNRLAGADFSTVGVTRPVTRDVHACVWGVSGSGALLEWLGVPRRFRYARASALDSGERAMTGLVLLDMPDHDSVMAHASEQVDHLVELADLMIWVLDPQKYADAAVHRRFLVPLAGHSEVLAVVLNQSDVLSPEQVEDCVHDLRRLLDSEELHDVQILVTSANTGAGIETLRSLLIETVTARRAAAARIAADTDAMVARFTPYAGEGDAKSAGAEPGAIAAGPGVDHDPATALTGSGTAGSGTAGGSTAGPAGLLAASPAKLAAAFARAAGVLAIGDSLQSARELRAVDYVGWPVSWLVERLVKRDPVRKIRLGKLWAELRGVTAGPSGAQQAEIDHALTQLADEVSPALPKPWSQTIRAAIRSRAKDIPGALGERIGEALPAENKIAGWWRAIGAWQGLLLGCVIVGLAWMIAICVFGVFETKAAVPHLFSDLSLLPLIAVLIVAMLVLGWLTASVCVNAVRAAAIRENEQVAGDMQDRLASVAQDLVVLPALQELAELDRFRAELAVARGDSA
jgi:GTP-binding protein EngB required for normal cell division